MRSISVSALKLFSDVQYRFNCSPSRLIFEPSVKEASMFNPDEIVRQSDCLGTGSCACERQFLQWGRLFAMSYRREVPLESTFPELDLDFSECLSPLKDCP